MAGEIDTWVEQQSDEEGKARTKQKQAMNNNTTHRVSTKSPIYNNVAPIHCKHTHIHTYVYVCLYVQYHSKIYEKTHKHIYIYIYICVYMCNIVVRHMRHSIIRFVIQHTNN